VDEFSTVLLLEMGTEGEKAVLNAAHWFVLKGSDQDGDSLAFWDEHSLDLQRFFGIACLAYGKDPKTFGGFVEEGILPTARADRCPEEYAKKSRSWEALLAPHTR
jgi:Putative metallopeptidase